MGRYFAAAGCGTAADCDDTNPAIHPDAPEACGNQIDDNCDGRTDEGCDPICTDADGDGYPGQAGCGPRSTATTVTPPSIPARSRSAWTGATTTATAPSLVVDSGSLVAQALEVPSAL